MVQQLLQHANPNALLLFEVGLGQAQDVAAIGQQAGWTLRDITNDLAGVPRVVALETN